MNHPTAAPAPASPTAPATNAGLVLPHDARRQEWLAARRTCITATDAAKILGVSPYGGPADVWLEKRGLAPERPDTPDLKRGRRREALVLDYYRDDEGCDLIRGDGFDLMRHPDTPLIGATLDAMRMVGTSSILPVEAKTARYFDPTMWGEHGSDEIPVHYALQVTVQAAVVGATEAHLAAEFAGDDYRRYIIPIAPSTRDGIIEKLLAWWDRHIVGDEPPEVTGHEGYRTYLEKMYPEATRTAPIVLTDPDLIGLGYEYDQIREALKDLEKQKELVGNRLRSLFEGGVALKAHNSWSATWKPTAPTTVFDADTAFQRARRLLEEKGELEAVQKIVKDCTTTKDGTRRLTLTLAKAGKGTR